MFTLKTCAGGQRGDGPGIGPSRQVVVADGSLSEADAIRLGLEWVEAHSSELLSIVHIEWHHQYVVYDARQEIYARRQAAI